MAFPLSYPERNQKISEPQNIGSLLDGCDPFVNMAENEEVTLPLKVTGAQFTEMFSAIVVGAELTYPEKCYEIYARFLAAAHCPPELPNESGDCYTYPMYSPFISYFPYNPYNDPDFIPNGYLVPPFHFGGIGYEPTDLLVDLAGFPINANWFDIIGGFLPQIEIKTVGDGQIELDLLAVVNGGYLVLKPNSPPNIADIFLGIFDPSIRIIDTSTDIAFPSELDIVIAEEYDVSVGTGIEHSLFITWIPALDDSSIPLRFGGGVRAVQLCGFESGGVIMGITDIRINNCEIEKFESGVWSPISGSLLACIASAIVPIQQQIDSNDTDISNLQGSITTIQGNISTIQGNVTTLQQTDVSLQNQINSNDSDIGDIILSIQGINGSVVNLQNQIDANDFDIAAIQGTNNLQDAEIDSLNLYANDHENRLDILEAAGGGGGGLDMVITSYDYEVGAANIDNQSAAWVSMIAQPHTFTHENFLIQIEAKASCPTSGQYARLRVRLDNGTQDIAIGGNESWVQAVAILSTEIDQVFEGIIPATYNINLDMATSGGGISRLYGNQRVQITIIEYSSFVALSDTVTFDDGGMAYSLPVGQSGQIDTVGNPDNCLRGQSLTIGQYIEVQIDIGSPQSITEIEYDVFLSQKDAQDAKLYIDGNLIETNDLGTTTENIWIARTWTSVGIGLPVVGQVVKLRLEVNLNTTVTDMRLDNVRVVY